MKYLLLFLSLLTALKAEETKSVSSAAPYVDIGIGPLPIPIPVIGVGGRFQQGHLGFDLSFQMSTVVTATAMKENIDILFYPKPNLESQFYLGLGAGSIQLFEQNGRLQGFLSPQLVVGGEYTNDSGKRRYLQARVDSPLIRQDWMSSARFHGKKKAYTTCLIFSYGCFF